MSIKLRPRFALFSTSLHSPWPLSTISRINETSFPKVQSHKERLVRKSDKTRKKWIKTCKMPRIWPLLVSTILEAKRTAFWEGTLAAKMSTARTILSSDKRRFTRGHRASMAAFVFNHHAPNGYQFFFSPPSSAVLALSNTLPNVVQLLYALWSALEPFFSRGFGPSRFFVSEAENEGIFLGCDLLCVDYYFFRSITSQRNAAEQGKNEEIKKELTLEEI